VKTKAIKFIGYTFLFLLASFMALFFSVAVPVMGITYHDEYIYFPDYEVESYEDVPIVINKDTFNNKIYGWVDFSFNIKFSSCPKPSKRLTFYGDIRNSSQSLISGFGIDKNITCSTSYQTIQQTITFNESNLSSNLISYIKETITVADDNYIFFNPRILDTLDHIDFNGVTLEFRNMEFVSTLAYEFNTTYYFDHIALDSRVDYPIGINATVNNVDNLGNTNNRLVIVYDSSNYYRIWNTDYTNVINRGRKKYNLDLSERFTAYGIGLSNYAYMPYNVTTPSAFYTVTNGLNNSILFSNRYYLLNYSSTQQGFPGTSMPDLEYQTCSAWDIPCHLGNALTYVALDLPITSDIYGLFSKGFRVVSNGLYSVTSIFGANFDIGGLIDGNFFSITLVISLGTLIVVMMVGGGDNDDE
jgi:hypothetical protein